MNLDPQEKRVVSIASVLSLVVFFSLIWVIYLKEKTTLATVNLHWLPALNSLLNFCAALALCWGFWAIKNGKKGLHKALMFGALGFSSLFLVFYLVYHSLYPDTIFMGQGWIRPVYFFILISHIVLTMAALPLILSTVFFGLTGRFLAHKRLARWTFPIWLYVSVTGVLIYLLLRYAS